MMDPILLCMIVLAALIVGFTKSGLLVSGGALNVPLLSIVMPARDAAGVLLPVMLVVDLISLAIYGRQIDRGILQRLIPGALAGTVLGWMLSPLVSEQAIRLAIGLITLCFVASAVLPLRRALSGRPPSTPWGLFWGTVAGLTSFVSHTGAPPFQIYVLPRRLPPPVFAGTSAVFFAVMNGSKIVPYYFLGQLGAVNLGLSMLMIPIAFAAMGLGYLLVRRIPARTFYGLAYALLFFLSLKLIWDGVFGYAPAGVGS